MSLLTEQPTQTKTFCINHPETETYLKCNRCGRPVCIKCVQRTPVGYRCKECLGEQRAGYYTATSFDYVIAGAIALILGAVGGFVMSLIGGFWLIAIFAGPIAGGIISEVIRRIISKRRGRYLALVATVGVAVGTLALVGLGALQVLMAGRPELIANIAFRNLGLWIYVALACSTTYARLRV
jgi:hypothetical protein